jgi:hypothetical protein
MDGFELPKGGRLSVSKYHPPEKKTLGDSLKGAQGSPAFNNLYVKNFPSSDFREADLIVRAT